MSRDGEATFAGQPLIPWRLGRESYVRGVRVSDPYDVSVPVALRIDFDAGPVWMVAGIPQAPEMQEVFVPGDEIMVVFTIERMRQIGFPDSEFLTVCRDYDPPTTGAVIGRFPRWCYRNSGIGR